MSARLWAAVAGCLLVALQSYAAVLEITERLAAAEGSSVMMHAPAIKNVNLTEWEFLRNGDPEFILQYYAGHHAPNIYSAYQGRVVFYPENGSILLQRLQETDRGVYKATVNLMEDKARTTLLQVIKPVPQPELQSSLNLAGSPVELVCAVPEGTAVSISWKKEGRPLPPRNCYVLSENATVLQIRNVEKSDCGFYSCNISNLISWKETTLHLTVTGLTPPLHHARRLAVVALMFVTVSAVSFVILLHQWSKGRYGKEVRRRYLVLSTHGLLCNSSLLLLVTSIIWIKEEGLYSSISDVAVFDLEKLKPAGSSFPALLKPKGCVCPFALFRSHHPFSRTSKNEKVVQKPLPRHRVSAAFVLLGLFFVAAAIGMAWVAATAIWRPSPFSLFRMKKWHHVIQYSAAPTTLIVNSLFATLLLHNIQQLHERGCSEAVELTPSCVSAAVAILVMLLLLLLHCRRSKQEEMKQSPDASRSTQPTVSSLAEETRGQTEEEE
ncbi:uncharacterized protein O3Q21_005886 isoform 2-T3 [Podargus strigoides]